VVSAAPLLNMDEEKSDWPLSSDSFLRAGASSFLVSSVVDSGFGSVSLAGALGFLPSPCNPAIGPNMGAAPDPAADVCCKNFCVAPMSPSLGKGLARIKGCFYFSSLLII